jgi:L-histidine N-alpha-methyltransferase
MNQFAKDVLDGLSANPKRLSSKYFYDENGDKLFQQIMNLEEYYLTRTEYEILDQSKEAILQLFSNAGQPFNLIEFGAGDGYKTKVLLRHFLEYEIDFNYLPIDISGNVLNILTNALKDEMPSLKVRGIQNEYFKALEDLKESKERNIILFLGSNIGNFTADQAAEFINGLYNSLKPDDLLFIGFDLKKDPDIILSAYNDKKGITKQFNLNLLHRINNELDGNFDVNAFRHYPIYNPMTGTTTSFLISTKDQVVEIMDVAIYFNAWEAIHMEISQKYDKAMIHSLATESEFKVIGEFSDKDNYFVNEAWQK